METKHIQIYTDGACTGNPGPGGFGYVILLDGQELDRSNPEGYRRTTNNRMEILAVVEALRYTRHVVINKTTYSKLLQDREIDIKITVCSDSQLVVNTINQGWSRKTNNDLWKQLDEAIGAFPEGVSVSFSKVKGHSGENDWNAVVDALAVESSQPENIIHVDKQYENISAPSPEGSTRTSVPQTGSLFPEQASPEKPVRISDIVKKGPADDPYSVMEVHLSNGSVMKVTVHHTKW